MVKIKAKVKTAIYKKVPVWVVEDWNYRDGAAPQVVIEFVEGPRLIVKVSELSDFREHEVEVER